MIRCTTAATLMLYFVAPVSAWAQSGDACSWAVGVAGNTSPAGRDWDLSTPESYWSMSPVVSQECHMPTDGVVMPWVGVDAAPTLQHRYRAIGERGTVGALFSAGIGWRPVRRTFVGPQLVTNMTAWGAGIRAIYLAPPRNRFGLYGAEVRAQWMSGINPDFQAFLLIHVHHRWTGWYSEEAYLPLERRQVERRSSVATGFEVGPFVSWRLEFRPRSVYRSVELGVRAGVLSNLFADAAVQPTGLAYVDVPLPVLEGAPQIEASGGVTRRDGKWVPLAGAAAQIDPADSSLQGQLGLLIGGGDRVWLTLDAGLGWVW